ncbi:30S ribosomal protein S2 [Haliangium ochraceum]|uniref:Small ribosomal subunit protein uS2 n=1 Tax=Haliangium ochraceum (strain DSM 14365 / JCM 11303 / SMP-2) TaxID=502025 RepID=D0LXP3_HALO1|nr:30S ribosomal protein S2 [Haliangium ochraceum]ACY17798.1 ribosomal protein S2 [Haliangium ochraceum DSM 14365]
MSETAESTPGNSNPISLRALLEAGVHFGHNTGRWNPKMRPYIFGARNGIHIVDLQQTVTLFRQAFQAIIDVCARGEKVLFVGTKKQAADVIRDEAARADQFHVTDRWLGGTLTNFKTVKQSLDRLARLEKLEEDGTLYQLSKKEQIFIRREQDKLMKSLGGIKSMTKLPGMMFVIDPGKEHIAVAEARKLEIPVVAITDTNCDPDVVDFVIPGNDDAIRAIRLFASRIADAAVIGSRLFSERAAGRSKEQPEPQEQVIHISSGGDGPRVELAATGGSQLTPEASASPEEAN